MIPAPSNRTTNVWPLADLFDALRRNGFQLRPDDYTQLVQVLDAFQPQSYTDLQALIAPLLVTSEEEQEKFDRIFEQIWQKEGIKPHLVRKKRFPWKPLVAGSLLLLVLAYVAFLWPGPAFTTAIQLVGPAEPFAVGDTLVFSVDSSMQKAAGPLARWQWETPDGQRYPDAHAPTLRVHTRQAGPLTVSLHSQRGRGVIVTTWTDSVRRITQPILDKRPVAKPDSVLPEKEPPFTLDVQSEGSPIALQSITVQTSLNRGIVWACWVVGGLLLLLVGIYGWLRIRKPKSAPVPASATNLMDRFTSDKPPLEIPLENREAELITLDQSFYRLVRTLRQPAESELRRLHIAQTMRSTIQEGGFPTLVFQPYLAEKEYIFLIDRSQVRSQQVMLFDYLFRVFTRENVCVERYFFHRTFDLFTNETHQKGITLRQLADSYRNHTLVIWSTGYPLLYPPYPVVEPAIREAFADWAQRAILTPVPFADWGGKERALQADFLLLPADMTGQLRLIQALAEKQPQQNSYLQQQVHDLYSTKYVDFEETDELEEYLGEDLFQWLAALAIYPRIRWEIILEMGRMLMPPEAVNIGSLLKLARISWMHEGHFPDYTRLELLKKLRPENEVKARQRLVQMLAYAEQYFPGEHFYDGEKYLLQTVNQFALYAHDPETFAEYEPAQQAFNELYQQRLYPDGATLRYLEKADGDWTTLLPAARPSVRTKAIKSAVGRPQTMGLQEYLSKLPEQIDVAPPEPLVDKRKPVLLAGIGVTLLGLIGLLYLADRPKSQEIDLNQQIPVTITLDTTDCVTAENTSAPASSGDRPARWAVYVNDSLYSFQNLTAIRSFPLRSLIANAAVVPADSADLQAIISVRDTNAGSNTQYSAVPLTRHTVRIRINCPKPNVIPPVKRITRARLRVSLEYTNPKAPNYARIQAYMNVLEADTLFRFIRPLKPAIFAGRSQVRYFRTVDKAAAEALAVQAGKALGIPIGVQLTKDNRTSLTHLEIWVNNGVATTEVSCQPVDKNWFNQFNGWKAKAANGYTYKIRIAQNVLKLELESAPVEKMGTALSIQAVGTIGDICRQNGVYLVSAYTQASRTVLVKNVTRTSCYMAVVNVDARQLSGLQGQAYLANLLKNTVFLRYTASDSTPGKAVSKGPVPAPERKDTLAYQSPTQSVISQTAPPDNNDNAEISQTKVPTQTSTERLRVTTARKETDAILQAGINAYQRGQYTEAIAIYNKFLAGNPANAYALDLKGYSLFKLGRYEEAVTVLLRATKVDASYAWAYFDLARVYCAMGQSLAADQARKQAINIQPDMQSIMQNDSEFMRLCRSEPSAR